MHRMSKSLDRLDVRRVLQLGHDTSSSSPPTATLWCGNLPFTLRVMFDKQMAAGWQSPVIERVGSGRGFPLKRRIDDLLLV